MLWSQSGALRSHQPHSLGDALSTAKPWVDGVHFRNKAEVSSEHLA